ncbi:MAG: hypothetical protein L3J43_10770 [Sulfurovum sp.]|nr:hypothetical protein [Sulfurovum sp.]
MFKPHPVLKFISLIFLSLLLNNCGTSTDNTSHASSKQNGGDSSSVYDVAYKGLTFYHKNLPSSKYTLNPLSDAKFNALSQTHKRQVADKLLSTLFFGYPLKVLEEKIATGNFISSTLNALSEDRTDEAVLEEHILDENIYSRNTYNEQVAVDILSRFYTMTELDSYYINNWSAYILTQTIMFSPAYELESSHTPNIARVYNRLVTMLKEESGMRYTTYVHMMSEDNWRRFRSPEDNGREMLEIFTFDMDDSHVPLAGKALKNWKLDRDHDTLVVSLNQNREPINLFGTTIKNGDDFYREMVKSNVFTFGVTKRLVDFFFPTKGAAKKTEIANTIVSSKPETWQDILLQIVFSEEYLLRSTSPKSAEALFFSTAKKVNFKHRNNLMHTFKSSLEKMHQASMKYKLGKRNRVPLDTLSFANYHKFMREDVLLRSSDPMYKNQYDTWQRQGWDKSFISNENFIFDGKDVVASLDSLVQYLFHTMISRDATTSELALFRTHMLKGESGNQILSYTFNMFRADDDPETQNKKREVLKRNITIIVLDYISRLSETYTHKEVK